MPSTGQSGITGVAHRYGKELHVFVVYSVIGSAWRHLPVPPWRRYLYLINPPCLDRMNNHSEIVGFSRSIAYILNACGLSVHAVFASEDESSVDWWDAGQRAIQVGRHRSNTIDELR